MSKFVIKYLLVGNLYSTFFGIVDYRIRPPLKKVVSKILGKSKVENFFLQSIIPDISKVFQSIFGNFLEYENEMIHVVIIVNCQFDVVVTRLYRRCLYNIHDTL